MDNKEQQPKLRHRIRHPGLWPTKEDAMKKEESMKRTQCVPKIVEQLTREQLDGLIGLPVDEAEQFVTGKKLKPYTWPEGQILPAKSLAGDVVKLHYNENNNIVSAETQASIDAKYSKN